MEENKAEENEAEENEIIVINEVLGLILIPKRLLGDSYAPLILGSETGYSITLSNEENHD